MDIRDYLARATKTDYMDAALFRGQRVTKTIESWQEVEMTDMDDKPAQKIIITFGDVLPPNPRKWITCKETLLCLQAMFGNETNEWVGKRVTLYPKPEKKSESGVAIRVFGSPDIERDVTFTLKLKRRKPRDVQLRKTQPPNRAPAPQRESRGEG